jgi:cysteine desulfurase
MKVYLDYNATTPLHPLALPFVIESLKKFGNPSSVHWAGRESKKMMTEARSHISKFLHCDPLELIFTAGGSEANNLALKGILDIKSERNEIICCEVEHPSVLKTVSYLREQGFVVHYLKVSKAGFIDLEILEQLLTEKTALVTCQLVNNETGNIFPIKKITKLAHKVGAIVHSDMVQGLGKIPIDLHAMDVDLASFAGHKFYSLKGAGVLYVKRGIHVEPLIHGGGQERSRRAGTENVLSISAFGEVIRLLGVKLTEENLRLEGMRNDLQARLLEISGVTINGVDGKRVPNTLNATFENVDGETLLINLDTRGFAVSSGAACSSGSQEPSPVLTAMGFSSEEASQSLRISLGWLTTQEEVDLFYTNLVSAVNQMRQIHQSEEVERELA